MGARTDAIILGLIHRQHGAVSGRQAVSAGMPEWQLVRRIRSGRWLRIFRGVHQPAEVPLTPLGRLMAACLATGGRAPHEAAGCLWGLLAHPPAVPVVSVGPGGANRHPGMVIHRAAGLPPVAGRLNGIPCTGARRTVADLAAVLGGKLLDDVVDRAMARRLVTAAQLDADLHSKRGRHRQPPPGPAAARPGHAQSPEVTRCHG